MLIEINFGSYVHLLNQAEFSSAEALSYMKFATIHKIFYINVKKWYI